MSESNESSVRASRKVPNPRRGNLSNGLAAKFQLLFALSGTLLASFGAYYTAASLVDPPPTPKELEQSVQVSQLTREIRVLRQRIDALPTSSNLTPTDTALESRIRQIEQRQRTLERIIVADPLKALEVPLLRRDIEAVRDSNNQALDAMRRSVEQVYDLSKWLLGAVLLGLLSLLASHFLLRKQAGES